MGELIPYVNPMKRKIADQAYSRILQYFHFSIHMCVAGVIIDIDITWATVNVMIFYQARALRALGLLLADGAPTVGRGTTF